MKTIEEINKEGEERRLRNFNMIEKDIKGTITDIQEQVERDIKKEIHMIIKSEIDRLEVLLQQTGEVHQLMLRKSLKYWKAQGIVFSVDN